MHVSSHFVCFFFNLLILKDFFFSLRLFEIQCVGAEETTRRRSLTDLTAHFSDGNVSPPPVPPLPANYSAEKLIKGMYNIINVTKIKLILFNNR